MRMAESSGEVTHTMAVVARRSVVPDAREFVRRRLTDWGLDVEKIHDAEVVASELVTNAAREAEGRAIRLTLTWNGGAPLLECWDPLDTKAPVRRNAAADDETGRGLALVEGLAASWGVRPEPTGGKTVWAALS